MTSRVAPEYTLVFTMMVLDSIDNDEPAGINADDIRWRSSSFLDERGTHPDSLHAPLESTGWC